MGRLRRRDGRERRRRRDRLGIAERVAGRHMIEPSEGDAIAFLHLALFRSGKAHQAGQAGDSILAFGAFHHGAVGERAAQHAGEAELAAMGGVDGLDRMGQRRAVAGEAEPVAQPRDSRRFMAQGLQQAGDAVARLGRADQHRRDEAFAQIAGEVVEYLVARRLDVGDQLLHQGVVVIGEALQHGVARFLLARQFAGGNVDHDGRRVFAIDEGALQREIDEAGDDAVLPDRDLPQQQRRLRGRLEHGQRLADAQVGLVDLVEEQDARDAEVFELAQDHAQRRQLALVRLADHDRRVAQRQDIARLMGEFDRAGKVDEGEAVAEIIDRGDIGLDAGRVGAGLGARIADRGAVAHRALARQGAGAGEETFEQSGLAALERADDREQPRPAHASFVICALAHVPAPCQSPPVRPARRKYFTRR